MRWRCFGSWAERGTAVTPTLNISRTLAWLDSEDHTKDEYLKYIGPGLRATYAWRVERQAGSTPDAIARRHANYEFSSSKLPLLHQSDVHTALHGYLTWVCEDARLSIPEEPALVQLFKALREQRPAFTQEGARADDVAVVMKMMVGIADRLNPLRNRASLAHPNEGLLDDPEAMLVINTVRTLLHYVNAKLAVASTAVGPR